MAANHLTRLPQDGDIDRETGENSMDRTDNEIVFYAHQEIQADLAGAILLYPRPEETERCQQVQHS